MALEPMQLGLIVIPSQVQGKLLDDEEFVTRP